jgi:hypothetical protein
VGTSFNIHHSRRTLATQIAERGRPYVPLWAGGGSSCDTRSVVLVRYTHQLTENRW